MTGLSLWLGSWAILVSGGALSPAIGAEDSLLLSFALVTAIVWLGRRADFSGRLTSVASRRRESAAAALALVAGFASLPSWIALIRPVGLVLGLTPWSAATPPLGSSWRVWAALLLAPWFEEPLYRERLLGSLRPLLGSAAAILLTSAAFALPHAFSWSILGTFLVGLALGAVARRGRSLAVCIALHEGLNAGIALSGIPPARFALSPSWGSAVAATALLAADGLLRPKRAAAPHQPPGPADAAR